MTAGVGAAPAGPGPVLDESDFASVHESAIQLLQGPLHISIEAELDHAFVPPTPVSVSICHLTCLSHVILHKSLLR